MWLAGGIYGYGYNVYVWLVGVLVRRYTDFLIIIITFPYSTCSSSFLQQHPYFFVHFLNVFRSCLCYFCAIYSKLCSRTFEIVQKSRSRGHDDIIISTRMYVNYESRDFHVRGTK